MRVGKLGNYRSNMHKFLKLNALGGEMGMDCKDIIVIIAIVLFILVGERIFPANPISPIINYVKNLFAHKS